MEIQALFQRILHSLEALRNQNQQFWFHHRASICSQVWSLYAWSYVWLRSWKRWKFVQETLRLHLHSKSSFSWDTGRDRLRYNTKERDRNCWQSSLYHKAWWYFYYRKSWVPWFSFRAAPWICLDFIINYLWCFIF